MRAIVVVPNHLPNLDFLSEWDELKHVPIIVVQDIGDKPEVPEGFTDVTIYDHDDIKKDLGVDAWIIPTQSSACRAYGYYKAWQRNPEIIVTLDTDCFPDRPGDYWLDQHYNLLHDFATLDWQPTHPDIFTRGFPYDIRDQAPVMLSHGLWSNIPDLDAPSMLHFPKLRFRPTSQSEVIRRYNYFPMCGMNLAWRTELTPAMWFGLFGKSVGFDQYDDIWAGILVKKVMDHLGWAVRSGAPSVEHRKQSNKYVNLRKQAPGFEMNEYFWQAVKHARVGGSNVIDSYGSLIRALPDEVTGDPGININGEHYNYMRVFKDGALTWVNLFKEGQENARARG